jgi:hypothetical protein
VSIETTLLKLGMFGSWSGPRRNRCFSEVFSVTSTLTAKLLRSSSPWLVWLSLLLLVLLVAVTEVPGEVLE